MRNVDTLKCMDAQGCLKHWMLPMSGFNADTTLSDHPMGSTPDVMPLDKSLFNNFDESMQRHIIHSSRIDPKDPKKFSFSMPTRESSACHRVWEGEPSSKRTTQCTSKITTRMSSIFKYGGICLVGLGNISGQCANNNKSKWCGNIILSDEIVKSHWTHDHAARRAV